jgi:GMP synthase (glutamine-hydrolysing)
LQIVPAVSHFDQTLAPDLDQLSSDQLSPQALVEGAIRIVFENPDQHAALARRDQRTGHSADQLPSDSTSTPFAENVNGIQFALIIASGRAFRPAGGERDQSLCLVHGDERDEIRPPKILDPLGGPLFVGQTIQQVVGNDVSIGCLPAFDLDLRDGHGICWCRPADEHESIQVLRGIYRTIATHFHRQNLGAATLRPYNATDYQTWGSPSTWAFASMKHVRVLRHVPQEALGNLEAVLRSHGVELEVVDCFAENWPAIERAGLRPQELAGLIVMGGPMNADDTDCYPFLATEVDWLRQAVAARLPTLGICLGAQLLAKSLGARVFRNRVKEIGWHDLELLPAALADPLLAGSNARETVFQWHADTFDPPPGAVQLARSALCEQQVFRYGTNAYGLQFHLEITAEMVADWLVDPDLCGDLQESGEIDPREIRRRAADAVSKMAPLADRVFGRFAALCRQQVR